MPFPDALLAIPHRRDIPFSRLTTLGVGGLCRWLFEPRTEEEAQRFIHCCFNEKMPYRILGGGANILALGDVEEPVLRLNLDGECRVEGSLIQASASHGHILLAEKAANAGLSGLEWAAGIPGRLGGAIRMNAGAHGGEWAQVLDRYRFLTPEGDLVEKSPEAGDFSYRWSHLQGGHLILSASARLVPSETAAIRAAMQVFRVKRAASQPKERSAGCFFKNPIGDSAGRLIDAAGLKGQRVGDAMVSPLHANFLVNQGKATPAQFQELMAIVREAVFQTYGVVLETEVEIW